MPIDGWTLILQAANFLILVWLLRRFLYRPVLAVIDRRRQAADAILTEAAAARTAAEATRRDLEVLRAAAGADRDRLIEAAHAQAEAERAALLDKARHEADALLADARTHIERERRDAAAALRDRAGRLAVSIAQRLAQSIAPEGDSAADLFLDRICTVLHGLNGEERASILGQLRGDGLVRVVSALPLGESARERCRQRLTTALDVPLNIQFADDRALIAGLEVHFPHTVLRHTWRDDLARALEELTANAHTLEHA